MKKKNIENDNINGLWIISLLMSILVIFGRQLIIIISNESVISLLNVGAFVFPILTLTCIYFEFIHKVKSIK